MIIRVGVLNNFNFTNKELKQIEGYKGINLFVNSNSFIPIKSGVKSIVTINPYLKFYMNQQSNIVDVCAFRVKVVGDSKKEIALEENKCFKFCKQNNKPILITFMRFASKNTLNQYTNSNTRDYIFKRGYFYYDHKLKIEIVNKLKKKYGELVYVCDIDEKGCPSCNNCARLTFGTKDTDIYSLDLSSSGYCPFNCPDCFAKRLIKLNKNRINFDELKKNSKMKGYKNNQNTPKIITQKQKK